MSNSGVDKESNSNEEEYNNSDGDTCKEDEIDMIFRRKIVLWTKAVSLKNDYILNLASNKSFDKVAIGVSDGSFQVFDISSTGSDRFQNNNCSTAICGIEFAKDNSSYIFIGRSDGTIKLFDLRTLKYELKFEEPVERKKPTTCFDVNSNNRVLCAGTELVGEDSFLFFYDIRGAKYLGAYWETHHEDVTCVKFHPSNPDRMISGSTDGLINIFDIKMYTEEKALQTVINTESSVGNLSWHRNIYSKDLISCITNTNDFKLYDTEEGDIQTELSRSTVADVIKRRSKDECYLINCHDADIYGTTFLLAGSYFNNGEVLRSVKVQNNICTPLDNFEQNKQIVRSSLYNLRNDVLITSGEGGIISIWKNQDGQQKTHSTNLKVKPKLNDAIHCKPY